MARDKRFEMRLSETEYVQLVERARQKGTTVSGVVREALGLDALSVGGERVVSDGRQDKIVEDRLPTDPRLSKLIKQLEAQGNPDAEEVARKRLGM